MNAPLRVPTSTRTRLMLRSFPLRNSPCPPYATSRPCDCRRGRDFSRGFAVPHGTDFDVPRAGHRNARGDVARFVDNLDVEYHVAAGLLALFGERSACHELPTP